MTLLKQATSPEVLNAAWKKTCNDKAIWSQGISRNEMESDFVYHITKLAEDLKSGSYKPDPVKFFPVDKGNGKQRIISAITLRDKIAQRAVLAVLQPIGEKLFHHDSFGYRPGRTIDMVISRTREYMNCGMEWVLDADIKSYFDNIPHKPLLKVVKSVVKDREILKLIKLWLDSGTVKRGFLSRSKGIPQGAVISPFLCNIYLTSWDNDMAKKNLPFVRFADDFLVFAKSNSAAEKARVYVEKTLNKLGLTLNDEKTRVSRCGPDVVFLGRNLPKINVQKIQVKKKSFVKSFKEALPKVKKRTYAWSFKPGRTFAPEMAYVQQRPAHNPVKRSFSKSRRRRSFNDPQRSYRSFNQERSFNY